MCGEQWVFVALAVFYHLLDVRSTTNPRTSGIAETGCGIQALTRARPLERRALSTLRPPLVLMRARKPWVFFRLRALG